MRITGGNYKGKEISTIKGQEVRPTSSKVRESIFNIIQLSESGTVFYEGETTMLDLFAGSGIMGLEALSRGAKKAVFVEKNFRHAEIIKRNIEGLGLPRQAFSNDEMTTLIISDALKFLEKITEKFNFIFIDPPYAAGLYEPILKKMQENKILYKDGFIILEHASSMDIQEIIEKTEFQTYKSKTYGDTGITVLVY